MKHLISYFAGRPVVANVVLFGIILSSVVFWKQIGKEEMPEFAMESVRVSVRYPGASAEDVELFITKPIEEKLKGITGLEEVTSSSSYGNGSLFVSFEPRMPNLQEKIQEVKDAVDSADLPREADEPTYRQFRSSEKAIIDIGMYLEDIELLTPADRSKLQKYVLAFKDKILSLPEISGVETQGYLRPELQIQIKPERLKQYEISMNQVRNQITEKHVRRPIGNLEDR
ncbi:MAG: efflux RND transporter permease subunit, partial [Bdellovibrionales bacterium]|nr:efflux RND transporter permease subunit [Bdellovibrionales bacterium]